MNPKVYILKAYGRSVKHVYHWGVLVTDDEGYKYVYRQSPVPKGNGLESWDLRATGWLGGLKIRIKKNDYAEVTREVKERTKGCSTSPLHYKHGIKQRGNS